MRAAAMMAERQNGVETEPLDLAQALVGPAEVPLFRFIRRDAFPQRRVANRSHAQVGNQMKVLQAVFMTTAECLVEPLIADAIDGTLIATPKL